MLSHWTLYDVLSCIFWVCDLFERDKRKVSRCDFFHATILLSAPYCCQLKGRWPHNLMVQSEADNFLWFEAFLAVSFFSACSLLSILIHKSYLAVHFFSVILALSLAPSWNTWFGREFQDEQNQLRMDR